MRKRAKDWSADQIQAAETLLQPPADSVDTEIATCSSKFKSPLERRTWRYNLMLTAAASSKTRAAVIALVNAPMDGIKLDPGAKDKVNLNRNCGSVCFRSELIPEGLEGLLFLQCGAVRAAVNSSAVSAALLPPPFANVMLCSVATRPNIALAFAQTKCEHTPSPFPFLTLCNFCSTARQCRAIAEGDGWTLAVPLICCALRRGLRSTL